MFMMFSMDKINIDIQDFLPSASAAPATTPQILSNYESIDFSIFASDRSPMKAQANPTESCQDNFSSEEFCIQAPLVKKYSSFSEQSSANADDLSFNSSDSIHSQSSQLLKSVDQVISIQVNEFSL